MNSILLSIKPEYAEKIFTGMKKYEYRRICCKQPIDRIYIYATSPVKKVIGEVVVEEVLSASPSALWEATKKYAGISRKGFREYFSGTSTAYAFKLGTATKYSIPKYLSDYDLAQAPQSFIYLPISLNGST